MSNSPSYRIAVIKWSPAVGSLSEKIADVLRSLGHHPVAFMYDGEIPGGVDVVFTYAPYGRLAPVLKQLVQMPAATRPKYVHWNTENPPDLRLPWPVMRTIGAWRAYLDRLNESRSVTVRRLVNLPPLSIFNQRLTKFRYVGEIHEAHRRNLLDLYVESSQIYTKLHSRHGLPTLFVPWGTVPDWHEALGLERDIDVLWMGTRRTRRRSRLLNTVCRELDAHGVRMHVVDGIENPPVHGKARTRLLNRAKITLNLLPTWDDNAFPYRFHLAAGNRSLVVTEDLLPHYPVVQAGQHYVSAPPSRLAQTILAYLEDEKKRRHITEAAFRLVTTTLTFQNSVRQIITAVSQPS